MMYTGETIDRAAAIIYGTLPESVIIPWREVPKSRRVKFEDTARAVLAVAEEPVWEYTYMRPDGYEDDFAGLPGTLAEAAEVAAHFPGRGVLWRRVPAGDWLPLGGEVVD